mmetsp:Transcript_23462/g.48746  ORF Transcript_23462/g.48746 Transcript_23462/m.48746 type:complete len:205 (+) Transcript_23462:5336-5950(+)
MVGPVLNDNVLLERVAKGQQFDELALLNVREAQPASRCGRHGRRGSGPGVDGGVHRAERLGAPVHLFLGVAIFIAIVVYRAPYPAELHQQLVDVLLLDPFMKEERTGEHFVTIDTREEKLEARRKRGIPALAMKHPRPSARKYERGQLRLWERERRREHGRSLWEAVQGLSDPELVAQAERSARLLPDSNLLASSHRIGIDVAR